MIEQYKARHIELRERIIKLDKENEMLKNRLRKSKFRLDLNGYLQLFWSITISRRSER